MGERNLIRTVCVHFFFLLHLPVLFVLLLTFPHLNLFLRLRANRRTKAVSVSTRIPSSRLPIFFSTSKVSTHVALLCSGANLSGGERMWRTHCFSTQMHKNLTNNVPPFAVARTQSEECVLQPFYCWSIHTCTTINCIFILVFLGQKPWIVSQCPRLWQGHRVLWAKAVWWSCAWWKLTKTVWVKSEVVNLLLLMYFV